MSTPDDDGTSSDAPSTSRRHLLGLAVAGAGAAVVGAVTAAAPASATAGDNMTVGTTNNSAATTTSIVHNGTTQNSPALAALRTPTRLLASSTARTPASSPRADFAGGDGVIGFAGTGTDANGVHGFSFDGAGVRGEGDQGSGVHGTIRTGNSAPDTVAVFADNLATGTGAIGVKATSVTSTDGLGGSFEGSRAPLRLVPAATTGAPKTAAHAAGELFVDSTGALYYCTAAGAPGTWVSLTGSGAAAPALHTVPPTRVYDSRVPTPAPGAISSGQSRVVSVADGRAIDGGAVTVANLVPAGATAVAYNFTITNTVGSGFLTVNPGTDTTITSSAITWSATGQILTTGSLVAISADRRVTVIAGGGGTTDFLIDIVGYYR